MIDTVTPEARSRMMAGIRAKNTKPERLVRCALFAAGYRFRIHRRDLPGSPDIVLSRKKAAIFVHGCFWHRHTGCRLAKLPTSNSDFWSEKLDRNVERDRQAIEALVLSGWRVLTIWECLTKDHSRTELGRLIIGWLEEGAQEGELPSFASG